MNAAEAIGAALAGRGVTQKKAQAKLLGEPQPNWSDYRSGKRNPTISKVEDWARRAGVTVLTYDGQKWAAA